MHETFLYKVFKTGSVWTSHIATVCATGRVVWNKSKKVVLLFGDLRLHDCIEICQRPFKIGQQIVSAAFSEHFCRTTFLFFFFIEKLVCPRSCESLLKIKRHLVQLLSIRIRIANAAIKIHRAAGIGKMYLHWSQKRYRHRASSCSCLYCEAFIVPLPSEKTNRLIVKSSLRHWIQVPYLFKAPLTTTVFSK